MTKPTRFYDAAGKPVTLTIGQTFVQVMPTGTKVTIKDGKVPAPPCYPGLPRRPALAPLQRAPRRS